MSTCLKFSTSKKVGFQNRQLLVAQTTKQPKKTKYYTNPTFLQLGIPNMEVAFEAMGLRSEKSVASHILQENAYGSNLVPDIANVNYLEGNLGRTQLEPLSSLPTVTDDVYKLGFL